MRASKIILVTTLLKVIFYYALDYLENRHCHKHYKKCRINPLCLHEIDVIYAFLCELFGILVEENRFENQKGPEEDPAGYGLHERVTVHPYLERPEVHPAIQVVEEENTAAA